jgi:hypothetical protein
MRRGPVIGTVRMLASGALAAAGLAFPAVAAAAPASTSFDVIGAETAFSSTSAAFVGKAWGDAGDRGAWTTGITRTPFTPTGQSTVTGGSFAMKTVSPAWVTDFVTGTVTGGSVQRLPGSPGCANETFGVTVQLAGVATSTTTGGTGQFVGILTHYRALIFGVCRTYFASIAGQVAFDYTP